MKKSRVSLCVYPLYLFSGMYLYISFIYLSLLHYTSLVFSPSSLSCENVNVDVNLALAIAHFLAHRSFIHLHTYARSRVRSLSRSPSSSRFRIHSTLAPRFCFFSSFPFARFIFSLLPRLQIAWSYSPFVHAQLSGAGSLFNRICDVIPRFSFCYTLRNLLCNDIRKRIQRSYC